MKSGCWVDSRDGTLRPPLPLSLFLYSYIRNVPVHINEAFCSEVNRYLPACRHANLGHHATSGYLCFNVSEKS